MNKAPKSNLAFHFCQYIRKIIPELFAILLIFSIAIGLYKCPLYELFHIPCPGCGMTRACKALLRLDIRAAFQYHSLFPIAIFWAVYMLFSRRIRIKKWTETILMLLSAGLFIIRWILILFLT